MARSGAVYCSTQTHVGGQSCQGLGGLHARLTGTRGRHRWCAVSDGYGCPSQRPLSGLLARGRRAERAGPGQGDEDIGQHRRRMENLCAGPCPKRQSARYKAHDGANAGTTALRSRNDPITGLQMPEANLVVRPRGANDGAHMGRAKLAEWGQERGSFLGTRGGETPSMGSQSVRAVAAETANNGAAGRGIESGPWMMGSICSCIFGGQGISKQASTATPPSCWRWRCMELGNAVQIASTSIKQRQGRQPKGCG